MMMRRIVPIERNALAGTKRKLDGLVITLIRPSLHTVTQDGHSNYNKDYLVSVEEVYTMSVSAKQR